MTSTETEALRPGDIVEIEPEYGFHPSVDRIEGQTVYVSFVDVEGGTHTIAFPREVLRKIE